MYICCTLYRAIVQSGCPMYEWSRETGEWREIPPLLSVALPPPRLAHSQWLTQWVTLDTPGNNSYLNGINRQWILNSSVTFVINEWQSDKYLKADGRYSTQVSLTPLTWSAARASEYDKWRIDDSSRCSTGQHGGHLPDKHPHADPRPQPQDQTKVGGLAHHPFISQFLSISDGVSGVTGLHLGLFSMRRRQLLIDLIQCPRQEEDRWRLTNVSQLPNLKLLTTMMVTTMTPKLRVMRMNICCQPRRSGSPELPHPSPAQAVFDISFSNGFYNPIVTILFISSERCT